MEKAKKEYLEKKQKDQEYLEKATKEFIFKQQEDQKNLENIKKEPEKQFIENKQKTDTQDFPPPISRAELRNITVNSLLKLPAETKVISFTFTMDNDKGTIDVVDNQGSIFTPQTISLMQNAIEGRIITIDKIRIEKNGAEKKSPGLIYKVTN